MQEENIWGLDLTHYGSCLSLYRGNGTLTLGDGERVDCAFEAGQLASGEVVLLCASDSTSLFGFSISVSAFIGTTAEGYALSADDRITEMNYLPDSPRGSLASGRLLDWITLRCGWTWKAKRVACASASLILSSPQSRGLKTTMINTSLSSL